MFKHFRWLAINLVVFPFHWVLKHFEQFQHFVTLPSCLFNSSKTLKSSLKTIKSSTTIENLMYASFISFLMPFENLWGVFNNVKYKFLRITLFLRHTVYKVVISPVGDAAPTGTQMCPNRGRIYVPEGRKCIPKNPKFKKKIKKWKFFKLKIFKKRFFKSFNLIVIVKPWF